MLLNLGLTGGAVTSQGSDINSFDQVVGTLVFDLNNGELNHGFLYRSGQMIDVNTLLPQNSGWVLRDAQAINDVGQIVGFGIINGEQHAYLLSPVPGDFDGNGTVDAGDYVLWRKNVGYVVTPGTNGDANRNGFVEWSDYGPWRENYGRIASSIGSAVGSDTLSQFAVVPEPSTLVLCLAGIFATQLRRNRRRF